MKHVRQKQSCRKFSKDFEMVHRGGGGPFKKKERPCGVLRASCWGRTPRLPVPAPSRAPGRRLPVRGPWALRSVSERAAGRRPETGPSAAAVLAHLRRSHPGALPGQSVRCGLLSAFGGYWQESVEEELCLHPCVRAVIRSFPRSFPLMPERLLKQRGPRSL